MGLGIGEMSDQPLIRKAEPDDLFYIHQCAQEAYKKYVERLGKKPAPMVADFEQQVERDVVDVLLIEATVVGYVVYDHRGDFLHLESVAVHPEFAGKGLGRLLIDHVEYIATSHGLRGVELYTNIKMTENIQWYPRLGYKEVDRRIEDGFERVYFWKALDVKADADTTNIVTIKN